MTTGAETVLQIENRGPVRFIFLNRPEVRNAINVRTLLALRKAVRQADQDEHVRTIVFGGRGGAFSAGADVKEWVELNAGRNPHPDHDWVGEAMQLVQEVARLPKPTIAMIDGAAVGAGLDMALACDFRVVSEKARFICAYTWIGYPPDCGGSWLLPRLIGIEAAVRSLKVFALLNGYRGRPKANLDSVIDAIEAVANYAIRNIGTVVEIDVNPLMILASDGSAVAVDALIIEQCGI